MPDFRKKEALTLNNGQMCKCANVLMTEGHWYIYTFAR